MLDAYWKSRAIATTDTSLAIPYRWLVPLNITFNRSLQNASSYYTDIGFVWLPLLLIVIAGLVGGIISRDRPMVALTGATVLVWLAWILVADGIVWYGMGMIVRTIISSVAVIVRWLYASHDDNDAVVSTPVWMVVGAIVGMMILQYVMNFMRMGSQ